LLVGLLTVTVLWVLVWVAVPNGSETPRVERGSFLSNIPQ
jgi:hypothetical protein